MASPFIGDIRMFGGSFAPRNYAFADGALLQVSQQPALFGLFGAMYGGDGRNTFGLPNLVGRPPIHHGQGTGLTNRPQSSTGGFAEITLTTGEVPVHNHRFRASTDNGPSNSPTGNVLGQNPPNTPYSTAAPDVQLAANSIGTTASNAHNNMQPFLAIHFIVALAGVYPTQS